MNILLACAILMLWFFLFGLECYLNGLMCRKWWHVPFVGLWQDTCWLFCPQEGSPGIIHYMLMHGGGLGIPLWLLFA